MLPCEASPQRVYAYNPEMKFVVMLREPVERAYSSYMYAVKNGWEDRENSFENTIGLEPERIRNADYDLAYFENGKYYKHLKNWLAYFPKERFMLIKDTELRNEPVKVMENIFTFLGIDPKMDIDTAKEYNKAAVVRSDRLQKLLVQKDGGIAKSFGSILPRRIKVWIRANIKRPLLELNQIEKKNASMDDGLRLKLQEYFQDDMNALEEAFNVRFDPVS